MAFSSPDSKLCNNFDQKIYYSFKKERTNFETRFDKGKLKLKNIDQSYLRTLKAGESVPIHSDTDPYVSIILEDGTIPLGNCELSPDQSIIVKEDGGLDFIDTKILNNKAAEMKKSEAGQLAESKGQTRGKTKTKCIAGKEEKEKERISQAEGMKLKKKGNPETEHEENIPKEHYKIPPSKHTDPQRNESKMEKVESKSFQWNLEKYDMNKMVEENRTHDREKSMQTMERQTNDKSQQGTAFQEEGKNNVKQNEKRKTNKEGKEKPAAEMMDIQMSTVDSESTSNETTDPLLKKSDSKSMKTSDIAPNLSKQGEDKTEEDVEEKMECS